MAEKVLKKVIPKARHEVSSRTMRGTLEGVSDGWHLYHAIDEIERQLTIMIGDIND